MAELTFDDRAIRELRRQCLHHNVFPISLWRCLDGRPPRVYSILKPIFDECLAQLSRMDPAGVKQIVDSMPSGYRMLVQPVDEMTGKEYLGRVAEYCIAAEVQKAYSPVSALLKPDSADSEVLTTCPELHSR